MLERAYNADEDMSTQVHLYHYSLVFMMVKDISSPTESQSQQQINIAYGTPKCHCTKILMFESSAGIFMLQYLKFISIGKHSTLDHEANSSCCYDHMQYNYGVRPEWYNAIIYIMLIAFTILAIHRSLCTQCSTQAQSRVI